MRNKVVSKKYIKARICKDSLSGCWNWTAGTVRNGYGQLCLPHSRKRIYAHRAAYILWVGAIPDGRLICHHCDNRRCVNPTHLYAGTQKTNFEDCRLRGRNKCVGVRGENHPNHKLNRAQVLAIRASDLSMRKLATKFQVSQRLIWSIKHQVCWKHL